jgi:hypothetical protein
MLGLLLFIWLTAGAVCFVLGSISVISGARAAIALSLVILPFYFVWMLPIYLAIWVVVTIW